MVSLITYADRLAGNLEGLRELLNGALSGLFSGVHILPFFDPIDGADAGFDPTDHLVVDPQLGRWEDVSAIAATHAVMADVIVNHVSADSRQFQDVLRLGRDSEHWGLFLRKAEVFDTRDPKSAEEQIQRIYRPRPGAPFTTVTLNNGEPQDFWTTFSPKQLDIDVESPAGQKYLEDILHRFADAGVRELRLDAAGYAIKRAGTNCFMLPETFDFIGNLTASARALGMDTLVEIHSNYQVQCEIAERVGRVYDFALPPLVLHSLYSSNASALKSWLRLAPRNCVTVLDTHDGIGIIDVGRSGDRPGLLQDDEIDSLVETIHAKSGGKSRQASGTAASNLDIYQVNCTYYDALGSDDQDYLIARAIQLFAPGTPQIYYVGLLAGENDLELVERTGTGRDINRHFYSPEELREAIERPVVRELFALIRLRNTLPVFDGAFSVEESSPETLLLSWRAGSDRAQLSVDLHRRSAVISGEVAAMPFQNTVGAMAEEYGRVAP